MLLQSSQLDLGTKIVSVIARLQKCSRIDLRIRENIHAPTHTLLSLGTLNQCRVRAS